MSENRTIDYYDDAAMLNFKREILALDRPYPVSVIDGLKSFNATLILEVTEQNTENEFIYSTKVEFETPEDKLMFLLRWL